MRPRTLCFLHIALCPSYVSNLPGLGNAEQTQMKGDQVSSSPPQPQNAVGDGDGAVCDSAFCSFIGPWAQGFALLLLIGPWYLDVHVPQTTTLS